MAARLTNAKKSAIQGMIANDTSVEEMAKVLDVSEATIQRYIDKLSNSVEQIERNIESFGFVNQTEGGRTGIAIMTEQASQKGDVKRPKTKEVNPRTKNTIHKIHKGKK